MDERVLRRTEAAEEFLMSLGFSDFRVRTIGEMAKIQIIGGQLPLLLQHRAEIISKLKQDYQAVLLDLETRDGQ